MKEEKKLTGCGKFIVGILILWLIGAVIGLFDDSKEPEKVDNRTPTEIVNTPAPNMSPKTNEEKANALLSGWNGSMNSVVKLVKGSMNDPDSFEHVETRTGYYENNSFIVSMKYRGKNAFGGVITKYVDVKVDYSGNVISVEKEY